MNAHSHQSLQYLLMDYHPRDCCGNIMSSHNRQHSSPLQNNIQQKSIEAQAQTPPGTVTILAAATKVGTVEAMASVPATYQV